MLTGYEMLFAAIVVGLYLEAGYKNWRLFSVTAVRDAEDQATIDAVKSGPWQYRFGAMVMILTWPLWTYAMGAAFAAFRLIKPTAALAIPPPVAQTPKTL